MRHYFWALRIILMTGLIIGTIGSSSGQNLPVTKGKKVVATVNGEPITLDEFNQGLASLPETKTGKEDRSELLRRLINIKLIVQEAKRIGLDELPEIKKMVDVFSRVTLREELMEKRAKEIKADENEVEKLYKESVKEYKIESVMLEKEEDAKEMEKEIKEGKTFEEIAKRFLAEGKARASEDKNYLKRGDLLPQIAEVISKMEVGSVSPIIPVASGFVILRISDTRYPEDQTATEQARREVLKGKQLRSIEEYSSALIKKYVKVHKEVFDRIDFESKDPGFTALLKDKRVVAEIKGEDPITVGELTEYLRQQLYHGVEKAIESKKLNSRKTPILEEMLRKRVYRKEALRLGLDKTENYKNKMEEYEDSVNFGVFINKAVAPDVKLKEDEVKAYYNEHIKEYTLPEMMRINSLVFAKRNGAEEAIEKFRKGSEFQWLATNAEGQVDRNTEGLLTFDSKLLLTTKDLPEGVQKAVSGARAGDLRLYASPDGYFYVLVIQDVIPSKPQPYEEARQNVAKKVFDDKLKKAVEDYADKLKAVSDVKIYLKDK